MHRFYALFLFFSFLILLHVTIERETLEADFLDPLAKAKAFSVEMKGSEKTKKTASAFKSITGAFARRWQCD